MFEQIDGTCRGGLYKYFNTKKKNMRYVNPIHYLEFAVFAILT